MEVKSRFSSGEDAGVPKEVRAFCDLCIYYHMDRRLPNSGHAFVPSAEGAWISCRIGAVKRLKKVLMLPH